MTEAERDRVEAEAFGLAAVTLEQLESNDVYKFAFRKGASIIRGLKPECRRIKEICKDVGVQIGDG